MPRITVTTDTTPQHGKPTVFLDEQVHSVHLSTGHASAQLVERLRWAVVDAEQQGLRPTPQDAKRPTPRRRVRRVASFSGVRVA